MASNTRRGPLAAAGARIAKIRNQRELSRRVVAELAGIHENTLKKIENGAGNPTLSVLLVRERRHGDRGQRFRCRGGCVHFGPAGWVMGAS